MNLQFVRVQTPEQLAHLAEMADEIWHEYWPERIGAEQTTYMVQMFHSIEAMERDIEQKGYRYWFMVDDQGVEVGYTGGAVEQMTGDAAHDAAITHSAVVNERWPRRFFISKIYLYASERGKHYGTRAIEFYEQLCRDEGLPAMYLTVNRDNDLAIRAYEGNGFLAVEDVDNCIGEGHVMYDHIMVKEVPSA